MPHERHPAPNITLFKMENYGIASRKFTHCGQHAITGLPDYSLPMPMVPPQTIVFVLAGQIWRHVVKQAIAPTLKKGYKVVVVRGF